MKKAAPQSQQSSPSQGQSITPPPLLSTEERIGLLIPLALVCLYWLCEVIA